ncbi:MAG: hypothetical protein HZA03_00015 [Nitrospinae bacterium]|nr:hypothetical protein [Nitrospinota bacterium]
MAEPQLLTCLLAEGSRSEIGHKKTLNGLFTGDDINVETNQEVETKLNAGGILTMPSMLILAIFEVPVGEYKYRAHLTLPSGKKFETSQDTVVKSKVPKLFIENLFSPFPIQEYGKYTLNMTLNDRPFAYVFNIVKIPK